MKRVPRWAVLLLGIGVAAMALAVMRGGKNTKPAGILILCGGGLDFDIKEGPGARTKEALRQIARQHSINGAPPRLASIHSGALSTKSARDAWVGEPTDPGYKDMFTSIGLDPFFVPLAWDNYDGPSYLADIPEKAVAEDPAWAAQVRASEFIFLNGGDQIRHTRALFRDNGDDSLLLKAVRDVLDKGGVVIGTSAGTHAQGEAMFGNGTSYDAIDGNITRHIPFEEQFGKIAFEPNNATPKDGWINGPDGFVIDKDSHERRVLRPTLSVPDDPEERFGSYGRGLNLTPDFLPDSHSAARGRLGRLLVAMAAMRRDGAFTATPLGIGVDENTCLYWDRATRTGKIFGEFGAWFIDVGGATLAPASDKSFSASNVGVSYLSDGDSFTLAPNGGLGKVKSSKQPDQLGPTEWKEVGTFVEDIFTKNQTRTALLQIVRNHLARLDAETGQSRDPGAHHYQVTLATTPESRVFIGDGNDVAVERLTLSIGPK